MGIAKSRTEYRLPDEQATLEFGAELTRHIANGVVYLKGPLGVGKTTVVRGFLRSLGYDGLVKSPTYTLIEPYTIDGREIAHIDLYRVKSPEELPYMGIEDVIKESDLMFVEWPERGGEFLPTYDIELAMSIAAQGRTVRIASPGELQSRFSCAK